MLGSCRLVTTWTGCQSHTISEGCQMGVMAMPYICPLSAAWQLKRLQLAS